jgi:hypothetical protein
MFEKQSKQYSEIERVDQWSGRRLLLEQNPYWLLLQVASYKASMQLQPFSDLLCSPS